jgi:prephenate dehydratase
MPSKQDPQNTIAFQGSPGAHSDVACRSAYPYMYTLPCPTFEDVFEAVESGKAGLGLIPIENSRAGRVAEIHNLLPGTSLHIIGEYIHKVRHHLLAPKGASLETVKHVYSHNQALMQCRDTLRKLGLTAVPFSDTAAAAEKVAKEGDKTKGALASDLAATLYGLEVIKSDMQDHDDNRTLFLTLSREPSDPKPEDLCITSILFTTRNIPAGLYKALGGFATNGINMLKLESYIQGFDSSTAQFFMSFVGHPSQKPIKLALEELGFFTQKVQVLGVYPADKTRQL